MSRKRRRIGRQVPSNLGALALGKVLLLVGATHGLPTEETQKDVLEILGAIEDGTVTTASYGVGELRDLRRRAEMPIEELRSEIRLGRARKRNPRNLDGGLLGLRRSAPTGPCSCRADRIRSGRNTHSRPILTDGQ